MQNVKLVNLYKERGYLQEVIEQAVDAVQNLENYVNKNDENLDDIPLQTLKRYIDSLIETQQNTPETILALARYYYAINNNEIYIYFTSIFGSVGVIPEICRRAEALHGEGSFAQVDEVALGLDRDAMPAYTKQFMDALNEAFEEAEVSEILAGNNHQIPREAMLAEKELYEKAPSLDVYLEERHQRKVQELTEHMKADKVWFEQVITQPVIDLVASNQEMLSAVREGDYLYVTKIPYNTVGYLEAEEDTMKRYHVCHCPFVKTMLAKGESSVEPNWCSCSAGFAKFPFEVILDRTLDVEVLETPLKGDMRCRFRIKL